MSWNGRRLGGGSACFVLTLALTLASFAILKEARGEASVDSQELETIQGSVIDVRRLKPTRDSEGGIEILIHSKAYEYRVLIGPAWQKRFDEQGIGMGDEVMVVGLTFTLPEKVKGLRAQEIRRTSALK